MTVYSVPIPDVEGSAAGLATFSPDLAGRALPLVEHWTSRARDGKVPLRAEIDPSAIVSLLPYVYVCERDAEGTLRYRLAGEHVQGIFGQSLRGRTLDDFVKDPQARVRTGRTFAAVLDRHCMAIGFGRVYRCVDRVIVGTRLVLPLRSGAGDPDTLIGVTVPQAERGLDDSTPWAGDATRLYPLPFA
ncbi:MAG: PAS domain-containing protein [Pseudomonadota bacterium]|nr:PAS domain-containing protein [Pseudomonadota bacterium]